MGSLKANVDIILANAPQTASRPARAAGVGGDWSPAANFNIFSITGGPVKITGLFGHVAAVFAGANATPWIQFAPSNVLPLVWNPIAVIAVAGAFPLNSFLVWDGSLTAVSGVLRANAQLGHDQSSDSVGTAATAVSWSGGGIHLMTGTIRITNGGAADATGQVVWYCTWVPLTPQSSLVAIV